MRDLDSRIESGERVNQNKQRYLLLALAPWPTLLSLIRKHPDAWAIWGGLPPLATQNFKSLGVEVYGDALPRPFHRAELPDWVRRSWRGIVVPALGNPLPSRWPVLRHMAQLDCPLFVASHGRAEQAPREIVKTDAFTWAFDRLESPPAEISSSVDGPIACVRGDLLGDILLTLPALASLGTKQRLRLIIRSDWVEWVRMLHPEDMEICGVPLSPWIVPEFTPAASSVDLSPPGWPSPLTPALARSVPAHNHLRISQRRDEDGLAAMVAAEFGLAVSWPVCSARSSDIGLAIPGGSSGERALPLDYWKKILDRSTQVMAIKQWMMLDTGDGRAVEIASAVPNAVALPYPQPPPAILSLCKSAALVLGVSTGITHLAVLTGTLALVIEHPTTVPRLYRAPVPFVRYVRPEHPWWTDDPTPEDLERALDNPEDSYGFLPGEWQRQVEEALARPPFSKA